MSKKKYIIIGAGGHSLVIIDSLRAIGCDIYGYFDKAKNQKYNNIKYLGLESKKSLLGYVRENILFVHGIGDNVLREKTWRLIKGINGEFSTVIHPSAIISNFIELGEGTFINAGTIINSGASIGNSAIINSGSIIEHEVLIGDFTHIGPGAVVCGGVDIGRGCFIGASSVIKQGLRIGDNTIIGMGSVVTKDVPANQVWVGNPAKIIQ